MKIDKKLIKELVDHLSEFNLTELEYQEGQTKIKVSKASKGIEQIKSSAVVSPNKTVLSESDEISDLHFRKLVSIIGKMVRKVSEGQQRDMDFENIKLVTEEKYLQMISGKTAAMFTT